MQRTDLKQEKRERTAPRLLEKYRKEIVPELMQKLAVKNAFEVPRLVKIVVNRGVGEGAHDIKVLEAAVEELAQIAGQRPVITRAKKAVSNFKIRKGDPIGCKVTLRRARMYEFLDRLINVAIPRVRDFRGLSPDSFDEIGNYTMGLTEQIVFPEIEYDKVQKISGMDITLCIQAKSREAAYELLKAFGMPFRS